MFQDAYSLGNHSRRDKKEGEKRVLAYYILCCRVRVCLHVAVATTALFTAANIEQRLPRMEFLNWDVEALSLRIDEWPDAFPQESLDVLVEYCEACLDVLDEYCEVYLDVLDGFLVVRILDCSPTQWGCVDPRRSTRDGVDGSVDKSEGPIGPRDWH
jgi:hypothetical protein